MKPYFVALCGVYAVNIHITYIIRMALVIL